MKKLMNLDEIIETLDILDADMVELNVPKTKMLVVGGLYMLVNFGNRPLTSDIDACILEPEMTDEAYSQFFRLVDFLKDDRQLDDDWLNDKITGFLEAAGPLPHPLTPWVENKRWKKLEMYFPPVEYICALKLVAARQKDESDLRVLLNTCAITTKDAGRALIDKYIHQEVQKYYNVDRKLATVFGS